MRAGPGKVDAEPEIVPPSLAASRGEQRATRARRSLGDARAREASSTKESAFPLETYGIVGNAENS